MLVDDIRARIALYLVTVSVCSVATRAEVLDQSFTREQYSYNLYANIGEGFAYVGQTITPAMSGKLTSAELDVYRTAANLRNWEISVREVVNGFPTAEVLATE